MAKYRRGRARARQSARTGALEVFVRPEQTLLGRAVGILIRLRVELLLAASLTLAWLLLSTLMATWAIWTVLIMVTLLIAGIPVFRRYVVRRFWCVLTRHRMKACFEQTRTMTHDGKLPSLLWSRPTPVGERVRVWLPAGLSVNDLERVTENIATACFARSARIERGRNAHLASILTVRRDPLDSRTVASDILGGLHRFDPTTNTDNTDVVVPLPSRNDVFTDLRPVTPNRESATRAPAAEHTPSARRGGTPAPHRTTPSDNTTEPAVRGFNGTDVSDYV
ncbi:hypothetical protein [Haloechinothrix salitolerans]|uniref:PrgI family protein n=1 Tax=Haloechinothrix salitolerans TaxID=926830 RepID=A0ABW2C4M8_9PSEU